MKTLALLLVCVAAASAYSYIPAPCAGGYSLRTYWVLPHTSCFRFNVYSCGAWFNANCYAPILKVYPGKNCEEMTLAEFTEDCENVLCARAEEIRLDLLAKKCTWWQQVELNMQAAINKVKDQVWCYTNRYLAYVSDPTVISQIEAQRDAWLETYCAKVEEMKCNAALSYCDAHTKVYNRVLEFHRCMVQRAVQMYKTREAKIAQFKNNLRCRVEGYIDNCRCVLEALNRKKVENYRCLLYTVHGSCTWMVNVVNDVVNEYAATLAQDLEDKMEAYRIHLEDIEYDLCIHYSCNYQITIYSGCLNFNKRSYNCYCQRLGTWWTCNCDRTIHCFKYFNYTCSWKKTQYKNLITCDVDAVNMPVTDFETEICRLAQNAIDASCCYFDGWKNNWETEKQAALDAYCRIIDARHALLCQAYKADFLCRYGYLCATFTCQIEDYEGQLLLKKTEALEAYERCLDERYDCACSWYTTSLDNYSRQVWCLADRIKATYSDCMTTRGHAITCYEEGLLTKKGTLREELEDKAWKVYDQKCDQYYDILTFYHGDGEWSDEVYLLFDEYKLMIEDDVYAILDEFDCYWDTTIPSLVEHYTCTYKCNSCVRFTPPQYCARNWYIVTPTVKCYKYRLDYFMCHRYYSIRCVNGKYRWCA